MTNALTATLPDGTTIPRLGLGTWAIGGIWTLGGEATGWGATDDDVSRAAICAGVDAGVRLFDTAQAYGCGHSERLLGEVLERHPEVRLITKIGLVINEETRNLERATSNPDEIETSLDASRKRLRRDTIDGVLLHLNSLPIEEAAPIFDRLETLRARGWIGHYGWSTDFPDRAQAMADRAGFNFVEHAMNVFFAADAISSTLTKNRLTPLIRSPLAMGLLGGRYKAGHRFSTNDVRSRTMDWMDYFRDGVVTETHAEMFENVLHCLTANGRSAAQGALAWILARSQTAIPVPGFRTPEQVEDLCGVLQSGPLNTQELAAVELAIARPPEGPPRER